MSKALIGAFKVIDKKNSTLNIEVRQCTLIEEHLEPILCVYETATNKREVQNGDMLC